jgi:hypothetical protein
MGELIKEFCYRTRGLLDRPAAAVASTLSLAVGIGACAVIFSIVNAVLLQRLPSPNTHLVEATQVNPNGHRTNLCDPYFDPEVASRYE